MRGDLPAGTRLLEQQLAAQFGLSREPIRDALRRLEQEGLVRSYQRRGVYVMGLTTKDIDELYDIRTLLETHAVRLAAGRASAEEVDQLQHLVDTMADVSRRGRAHLVVDLDIEFHRHVMLAADRPRLLAAWELSAELASDSRPLVAAQFSHISVNSRRPAICSLKFLSFFEWGQFQFCCHRKPYHGSSKYF